ncbi:MAG: phosphate ABC transporter substrate-binding protein PstS [Sulfolobales archaeon]
MSLSRILIISIVIIVILIIGVAVYTITNRAVETPQTREIRANGGGSSFINPQMQVWARSYYNATKGSVIINYQSIGSGAGQRGLLEGSLDFAGSDIPLIPENYKAAREKGLKIIQFPIIGGSVAVVYNIPEWNDSLCGPLRMTPEAIAGIYLGEIAYWDDPAIRDVQIENCRNLLPHKQITAIHRSDGSGTTYLFTLFLSKAVPKWNSTVGYGLTVAWPVDNIGRGVGGKGSEGLIALVKQTPYSIGYVEPNYAKREKIPIAAVRNKLGQYLLPEDKYVIETMRRGAQELPPLDQDLSFLPYEFVYRGEPDTYPIVGTPYIILSLNISNDKLLALKEFFKYALSEGQMNLLEGYVPLPSELRDKIISYLDQYIK